MVKSKIAVRTGASKAIREIVAAQPSITLDNLLRELAKRKIGCTRGLGGKVLLQLRRDVGHSSAGPVTEATNDHTDSTRFTHKKPAKVEPFRAQLEIPVSGLQLKLTNGSGMVGTLLLDSHGLAFVRANAKKPSGRKLGWDTLGKVLDTGLFG